jgi:propionate CoA-transferase
MDFEPIIRRPRAMDPRIFRPEPMGLRDDILQLPFDARFSYDEQHHILFLNFSELRVKSSDDIDRLKGHIQAIVEPLGHKIYAVVNYDGSISPVNARTSILNSFERLARNVSMA